MAPHSSTLAWKIPWMEKSMGSLRVGQDWSDLAAARSILDAALSNSSTLLPATFCLRTATQFSSVQLSHLRLFATPWTAAHQASLSITNSPSPPKPMSSVLVMPSNHLTLCHPLLLLPSTFPSIRAFSNESGGQNIGVSPSTSTLPMNTQDWSPLGWAGWISLQPNRLSGVFSNTTVQSINSSLLSFLYSPTLTSIHDHWKNLSLD